MNMERPKPSAYADFARTKDLSTSSRSSIRAFQMNNNSMSSRSASTAEFMRSIDPSINNNNSNSTRSSLRGMRKKPPVAASLHPEISADYMRQHSAAMFAMASNSSTSTSGDPSYRQLYPDEHDYNYMLQRKDPPCYDSRPNLKNDLSDSYQPYNKEPTNEATHIRSTYEDTQITQQQQPSSIPVRTTPIHHNTQRLAPPPTAAAATRKPAPNYEPRPTPRAGKPPSNVTRPVCVGLPDRTLGSRGLLLGRSKQQQLKRRQLHFAPQRRSSEESSESLGTNENSLPCHDPGPCSGLSTTISVECTRCGTIIENVAKNAIALQCPSCQGFFPTVTCRIVP